MSETKDYTPIAPEVTWASGHSDQPKATEMMMQTLLGNKNRVMKHVQSLRKSKKCKVIKGLSDSQIAIAIHRVGLAAVARVGKTCKNESDFLVGIEKERIKQEGR